MVYQIRPGLTFCRIGGAFIFLDLPRNRYFQLGRSLERSFDEFLNDDGTSADCERSLCNAGILEEAVESYPDQHFDFPVPPERASIAIKDSTCTVLDITRVLWAQFHARRQLRASSLQTEMAGLVHLVRDLPEIHLEPASPGGAVIKAFEVAKLIRSPTDLCLPRSIAMVRSLAKVRVRARLVLGVKLAPFGAHAWAQANGDVLNDSHEEVAKYTPIFAL